MKNLIQILLYLPLLLLTGCSTTNPTATQVPTADDKAHQAASWVQNEAGLIEVAVAGITEVVVYSTTKDAPDRDHINSVLNSVASALNSVANSGSIDPTAIKNALDVKEPYFAGLLGAVADLISTKVVDFEKNGYGDFAIEVIKAVSAGIKDATGN